MIGVSRERWSRVAMRRIVVGVMLCVVGGAGAQESGPGEGDGAGELPSLDALLGLDEHDQVDGGPDETTRSREDLDRELDAEGVSDRFAQAVALMDRVASRLIETGDVSVETQRLQEDVLRKLDQVIESAQRGQSGSSSGSQQAGGASPERRPRQGGVQSRGSSSSPSSESGEGMPPGRRDGALGDVPAAGAGWGELPPRVRSALTEGLGDRFSSVYRSLTESYYRRLAEEGGR